MVATTLNNNKNDDIVKINAGGKVFQASRSTLCLPPGDTAFSKLFGKNFNSTNTVEERRDAEGNFFFDHDPELIEIILNFLRAKKIEDKFDPIVEPPEVPSNKKKEFRRLLNHFGLTAFFYYPSIPAKETGTITVTDEESPFSLETESLKDSLHKPRTVSIGSLETASTANTSKFHDSWTTPEDEAIALEFDYCYG